MSWLTLMHKQTAVYWSTPSSDGMGGYTFATPVEILCRWEDIQKMFIDADGNEVRSTSVVYLGQDVDIGGWLYLGDLDDISSADEDSPGSVSGAKEIRSFSKIPNFNASDFQRKVML